MTLAVDVGVESRGAMIATDADRLIFHTSLALLVALRAFTMVLKN
mgnify:CR=1